MNMFTTSDGQWIVSSLLHGYSDEESALVSLKSDLADLINQSHRDTWSTFDWVRTNAKAYGLSPAKADRWKTPGEPAFVSSLLEYPIAAYRLYRVIHRHLSPLGLSSTAPVVSGVFIHQKPKVRFKPYRSQVELGDILLVRQHFRSKVGSPEGRAVLIQAKSGAIPRTGALSGKEAQQFHLYANWNTPFVFPNGELGAPPDGAALWDFAKGPAPHQSSGAYGLVANTPQVPHSFPERCAWAVGQPSPPATGFSPFVDGSSSSLAGALAQFLVGKWGRKWDAQPSTTDHWSWFVRECLRQASTWKPYPVQRIGVMALPRRSDVVGLVKAVAAASTSIIPPPLVSRFTYADHLDLQIHRATRLTSTWRRTLADQGTSRVPPEGDEGTQEPSSSGLSVLYVATTGDGALHDLENPAPTR